jgi:DNA-binding SARP family transcriptional activator
MKNLFAFLLLVPLLGGCNWQTTKAVVVGVDNPVTVEKMYQVEQAAVIVTSALSTYRSLCAQKLIDQKCRNVIVQAQAYTRPAAKQLVTLRAYFKANDKLNAINAYNTLTQLLADARAVAVQNGIVVQ